VCNSLRSITATISVCRCFNPLILLDAFLLHRCCCCHPCQAGHQQARHLLQSLCQGSLALLLMSESLLVQSVSCCLLLCCQCQVRLACFQLQLQLVTFFRYGLESVAARSKWLVSQRCNPLQHSPGQRHQLARRFLKCNKPQLLQLPND